MQGTHRVVALKAKKGDPSTAEVITMDGKIHRGRLWYNLIEHTMHNYQSSFYNVPCEFATKALQGKFKYLLP